MKRIVALLILLFLLPIPAHGALFFEFNPDYSQSLLIATSETVSEVFLPLNDYLGALDFWVSNSNSAGDATFTLYNTAGMAIAERTVEVPPIADSENGTRLRVNLPAQIAVTGNTPYRVRISTTSPTLRLYYAAATALLAHNGVPLPAYTGGLARIGSEDKGFSFKFALYENKESTPPQLTNVAVNQESPTRAIVTFNANEPIDRRFQFGNNTIALNGEYSSCASTIQNCTFALTVAPATTYNYTLTVQDVWGNQSTATGTFTSLDDGQTPTPTPTPIQTVTATPTPTVTSTPDTTKPIITNARLVSFSAHSAVFAWTTSKATNGIVVAQILPYFIAAGVNSDGTLELEHTITLSDLPADTLLRVTITSSDTSGNSAKTSIDFTTLLTDVTPTPAPTVSPGASTTPPVASLTPTPSGTPVVAGPNDNPQLTWAPPAGGDPITGYRIDIFDSNNNLVRTITVAPGQHQVALGLLPAGNNRVVVYSNNDGVFEKVATPTAVTTQLPRSFLELLVIALPYILGGIVLIILVVVVVMKFRKPKTPIVPTPATPKVPFSGATPNPSQL